MKTIKEHRIDKLWTQKKLAEEAHLNRLSIYRAESGAPINLLTFAAICKALGVSREDVSGVKISEKGA